MLLPDVSVCVWRSRSALFILRFTVYKPNYKIQTDTEALEDARREAMDLPPINRTRRPGGESIEVATDEAVYERFKKR